MRNFILGTDWWTDCDDVVALRLLARAHKEGRINLMAIGINGCMEYSVASVDGFLASEGVQNIPLGIDLEADDFGRNPPYQKGLAPLAVEYKSNEQAEDTVRLYRRILAAATEPVEIIEIGYMQVIAGVLESDADDISEKTGLELFKEKVSKVWMMAGKWTADGETENNFCRNPRTRIGSEKFCRLCPVPVTFLGWEVGFDVVTGDNLAEGDVLYQAMCDHGSPNGRMSWDPMLVMLALVGDEGEAGYTTVRGWAKVDPETGANYFTQDEQGLHQYVVKAKENEFYKKMINDLLV